MTLEKHPCRWSRTFAIVGPLLLGALCWLAHTIYAAEMERVELKTKLESMVSDVSEIKEMIKKAVNKP